MSSLFAQLRLCSRGVQTRNLSLSSLLERSLSLKSNRLPKGAPKRTNPFLYRYDKKGRVIRLKLWNVTGYGKIPFDKSKSYEFGIDPKAVHETKWGGSELLRKRIGEDKARFGYQPGYKEADGTFVVVPEMIPEFVVPDLKEFDLKPYVPYTCDDVHQSEFTTEDLFNCIYADELASKGRHMNHEELDAYLAEFKAVK